MPDEGHVLRVFRFRPVGSEFDGFLRTEMLPDVRRLPGLLDVHVGRRDQESGGDRIVATVWESRAAMIATVGATLEHVALLPGSTRPDDRSDARDARPADRPAVRRRRSLRRCCGCSGATVRPGELDDYVAEMRTGTLADAAARPGPARPLPRHRPARSAS